jgi:hypothetical protein
MIRLALALLALIQDTTIDDLIQAWRGDDAAMRDRATREILRRYDRWTPQDLTALERASKDSDPDVAELARQALTRIPARKTLGPEILEKLPHAEPIFLNGSAEERTQLLFEASKLARDRKLTLPSALLRSLLRSDSSSLRKTVFDVAGDLQATDLARDIVDYLKTDLDAASGDLWTVRTAAVEALAKLRAIDLVPEFLELLKAESPIVRWSGANALAKLQANSTIPEIGRLLGEPDPGIRCAAAYALGKFRTREFKAELAALLKDPNPEVRNAATFALGAAHGRLRGEFVPGRKVFKSGEKVTLLFTLTNAGDVPVPCQKGGSYRNRTGRDDNFSFEIRLGDEKLKDAGESLCLGGLACVNVLEPGESHRFEVDLSHWGELTRPGAYRVRCRYGLVLSSISKELWDYHHWDDRFDQEIEILIDP